MPDIEKLCPHFHLSLQSGCDETLKRMNRHYDTAEYRRIVNTLRSVFPNAAITTDMMVGFAGETEEEFAKACAHTVDNSKDLDFTLSQLEKLLQM